MLTLDPWKRATRTTLAAATAAAVLDAIEALCTSGVMFDDGWTCTRDADTFGLVLVPPNSALADDLRIIIAGRAVDLQTPTMLLINGATALDTDAVGVILCGLAGGDAGGYSTINWDAADPVGSVGSGGWFSGYIRGATCASNSHITVFYNTSALRIVLDNNTNGSTKPMTLGAWIDPLSTEAADCEANGYLYAMHGIGSVATTGMIDQCWHPTLTSNSATANRLYVSGTGDGNAHCVFRDPSSGLWQHFVRNGGDQFSYSNQWQTKTAGGVDIPSRTLLFRGSGAGATCIGTPHGIIPFCPIDRRHAASHSVKVSAAPTYANAGYLCGTCVTSNVGSLELFLAIEDFVV